MPRQAGAVIENNFSKGLITEATGLKFPENACTETQNCIFDWTGQVSRRLGIDLEVNHNDKTINRGSLAVSTFLWKNVAGDGNTTLLVAQIGTTIYFWDLTDPTSPSNGALASTVDMTSFAAAGGPSLATAECQFASGGGHLFVVHPYMEPIYVDYSAGTLTGTQITINIRDFVGIASATAVNQRRATLSDTHRYNLGNQGWQSTYSGTSSTSVAIATGSKTFATQTTLAIAAGSLVKIYSTANHANFMVGAVTSYSAGSLVVNVTSVGGSGTLTDWNIVQNPDYITQWFDGLANYPSSADVWWHYKDTSEVFQTSLVDKIFLGNTAAPKGHYILNAFNQDRSTASGITGLTSTTSSFYRPTVVGWFSSRVFFAGVPYSGYSGNIYFSNIITGTATTFGQCYQAADPTAEDLFDLLPNDGGVISVNDCGTIHKLFPMTGGLVVLATNGIWLITGSTGIGFTASDYTIRKISSIGTISGTSFVDIAGFPAFWTAEGIYILKQGQLDAIEIESMTNTTIRDFYNTIPVSSKRFARGSFNLVTSEVQWIYSSTEQATTTTTYEFDSILNFNLLTGAFYNWQVAAGSPKINSIFTTSSTGGAVSEITVIDAAAETVIDAAAETVVVYSIEAGVVVPTFKYLVSYPSSSTYKFTFADSRDERYVDWYSYDSVGVDYTSYFISGYKLQGNAQKLFQGNYIYVYSDTIPSRYDFQGRWNYAISSQANKWGSTQTVIHTDTNYSVLKQRMKIPGEGLALQFKVTSKSGYPFGLIGWSVWETANAQP